MAPQVGGGHAAIVIPDEVYPFVVAQQGALYDLRRHPEAFREAYQAGLWQTMDTLMDHLPERCEAVLDVGAGVGGINLNIAGSYIVRQGHAPKVHLLDARRGDGAVKFHGEPFGNETIARRFLRANALEVAAYHDAEETAAASALLPEPGSDPTFDLVVSFAAWGFHFRPALYADWVLSKMRPGGRVILDVRRGKPEWERQFGGRLKFRASLLLAEKFERVAYDVA